jgi:hypothetical protein
MHESAAANEKEDRPLTQKVQFLEAKLHKRTQELQHQQKMVKKLLHQMEIERERRLNLEDMLFETCGHSEKMWEMENGKWTRLRTGQVPQDR